MGIGIRELSVQHVSSGRAFERFMLRLACVVALFAVSPVAEARMPVFRELRIAGLWESTYATSS